MAKYNSGVLGTLSGRIGPLVAATWNGITYLRTAPVKTNKKCSLKQAAQRRKFKVAYKFFSPLADLVKITFRSNERKTGLNLATGYLMKNALTGTYPDITIDYTLVRISRGDLPAAASPDVLNNGSQLTFMWTPNSETGSAAPTDKVVLVVYCPAMQKSIYRVDAATRADGSATINASNFKGEQVHTYVAFIRADEREASDSVYTGSVEL
jgi:hypothetical protein